MFSKAAQALGVVASPLCQVADASASLADAGSGRRSASFEDPQARHISWAPIVDRPQPLAVLWPHIPDIAIVSWYTSNIPQKP